jgi:hypothetical protein
MDSLTPSPGRVPAPILARLVAAQRAPPQGRQRYRGRVIRLILITLTILVSRTVNLKLLGIDAKQPLLALVWMVQYQFNAAGGFALR